MTALHVLLFANDLALALRLRRDRGRWLALLARAWFVGLLLTIAAAVLLSSGLEFFGLARALAAFLFVHVPTLLLVTAALAEPVRVRAVAAALTLVVVTVGLEAFVREPRALEITRHVVETSLVRPIRIVVISDLQTDAVSDYERSVLARARALAPDLVLLPGDFVQLPAGARYRREARDVGRLLASLPARLGVHAVEGNVEHRGWTTDLFEGTGVHASPETTTRDLGELAVTALSFEDSFDPTLRIPRRAGYHVVFGHGPDFARGRIEADLLVAGHTHGGQVQLPGIGPLVTFSTVSRRWASGGLFTAPAGAKLVVSRGVGMERGNAPRLRFLCRPELVVIELR